jgi:CBS domain-containing protein
VTDQPTKRQLELRELTIADLMATDVITVKRDDKLGDVHSTMRMAGIRHVPVVNDAGALVGIVSDRDVQMAWARGTDTPVDDFMSKYAERVSPTTSAREAAARMLENKIGSLPVVDEGGKIVGIVTETDFLVVAHQALSQLGVAKDE